MGRTVVIGGGAAGLAAAYTMESAGVDCLVLEKRDFSGGRIHSAHREGFTFDLGAQFYFSRFRSAFALVERLGLQDEVVISKPYVALYRDGRMYEICLDQKENIKHPLETFKGLRVLSPMGQFHMAKWGVKMLSLFRKLDFDDPYKAVELDTITFAEHARKNYDEEILEYIFQPFASTLSLGEPEEVSAAYGLALMHYLLPGLSTLKGGMGALSEEITGRLSDLRLNTTATRIVLEGNRVKGVEVASGSGKDFIEADNVVCATLAGEAASLLPYINPQITDILSGVRYSASTHVMFAVPGRPFGKLYAIVTPRTAGFSFSGIVDSALKSSSYAPPGKGIIHVFTFGDHAREMLDIPDDVVRDKLIAEIRRIVPTFPEPIFCEIFRWKQAVCLSSPGQIEAVQRIKAAIPGYRGLYLAGEYLGMPSVEAAVHFGVQAAERVIGSQ